MIDPRDLIQGTPEWAAARCGSLGASSLHEALARTKSGWGASRANLKARLVAERLTGIPQDTFMNDAMRWGIEHEAEARAAYAFFRDAEVAEVGLVLHPGITGTHASPDGLVGDEGVLELKCPGTAAHIDVLLTKSIPDKYLVQMQWQIACTGRAWADYCSYDPRMPGDLQLFVQRVPRDNKRIAALESEVREFLAEVDATIAALTGRSVEHLGERLRESATILGAAE